MSNDRPYLQLKLAHRLGYTIQMLVVTQDSQEWMDNPDPAWELDSNRYRVKPGCLTPNSEN